MPYFNESYHKVFLATKATTANSNQVTGFIVTAGLGTNVLSVNTGVASTTCGVGSWGLFDAKTFKSVTTASLGSGKQALLLAAASVQLTDKIGPFHGGYKESNKSKDINPKLVSAFQKFVPCLSRQHTMHVGTTKYTKTLSPTNSTCSFTFLCGEDYNLRIEISNDPPLRYLKRNIYRIFGFNGGCCATDQPATAIDGTLAMIAFANGIINDPELKDFISPIVYSEEGDPLYPPGTAGVSTWDNYVSPGHVDGTYAGLRLQGAYVDTVFNTCSFQVSDYYGKVPLLIKSVSMVDFNGAPCEFENICAVTECLPFAGNGFGETDLRDLILSERYRQNTFDWDVRIREVMEGTDIANSVDRTIQYYRYSITHNIPRRNNNTNSYSEDQYTLDIITNGTVAVFETLMSTWLGNASSSVTLETFSCGTCTPLTP